MGIGSWFDEEQLLPGERLIRSGLARLRTDVTPRWWEGQLILTTDRLFFLPFVENPLTADVAFWVRDLVQTSRAGRNRLFVQGESYDALFQLRGARPGLADITGVRDAAWLRDIDDLQRLPGGRRTFEDPRRAVG